VDISNGGASIHAFECLVRGPAGTNLERPDVLFEYVRRKLRQPEVDRACIRLGLARATELPAGSRVSLNVHAFTLSSDAGFFEVLREAAGRSSIPMENLIIEIVEFAPGWGGPSLFRALDRLRDAGCAIALDDVGHGQSNYRMILDSAPDYFKLDRYFVQGAWGDPRRRVILESVRDLAARFGAQVVAEGVEEDRDLRLLSSLSIPLVQGFLFAPAREPDTFSSWIPGASTLPDASVFA
jgi:EAL domain-containing protein (putative c-di-GMP-specific phosphodiesterase class I)